jgi:type VI secretion system secreted protein Hcp
MRRGFVHGITSLVLAASLTVGTSALAGSTAGYVSIKGQKQGQFKGESPVTARAKQWIDVLAFKSGVVVPTDPSTGSATGRRKHDPVCFTKVWGPASPQLFSSAVSNETLTEVSFEFVKPDAGGKEMVFQTIKLTNAQIVEDRQRVTPNTDPVHAPEILEDICFDYQRIDITNNDGHTQATDTW